ncbi:MAG: hypothetical protein VW337_08895, partial [Gammaproteobacteria bacterium]
FGVLRGVIIVLIIVLIGSQLDISQHWFNGSSLVPYAVAMIDYLQGFFEIGQEAGAGITA